MSWTSILPEYLSAVEKWIVRIFILLGLLTIGPWLILIIYDLLLYIFRSIAYEIPYFGGRARGRQRPRAPSLKERSRGRPTNFSFASAGGTSTSGNDADEKDGLRERLTNLDSVQPNGEAVAD
ncbi:hypothetical protein MMC09_005945 [Bachmanniomyces sp. S44760]|nr:hypothetical protein [Bachmanniomyces sp. S44760]